jgi:hypothetical protein
MRIGKDRPGLFSLSLPLGGTAATYRVKSLDISRDFSTEEQLQLNPRAQSQVCAQAPLALNNDTPTALNLKHLNYYVVL